MSKTTLVIIIGGLSGWVLGDIAYAIWDATRNKEPVSYTVQCAVVTPSGPVPTVSLKGKDVVITDFGIVKMKEGLYIPTVSEICLIKKETE